MFESKRRALIFMVLSFILAAIAGMLFYNKYQQLNSDLGKMTDVYVAGKNIPSRQIIKPDDVVTVEIPNRYVTDGHILSLEQLENQVSIIPLKEGDLITHNILKPYTELTADGMRLVELLIDNGNVHFDEELEYLDRVDIIVSHSFEDDPVTELFMRDVPVHKIINDDEGLRGVALEVSTEDAPELIHMQNYADYLRVLKSGAAETGKVETKKESDDGEEHEIAEEKEDEEPNNNEDPNDNTEDKKSKNVKSDKSKKKKNDKSRQ